MTILNLFGISDAFAQATTTAINAHPATAGQGSLLSLLPTLIIFILVFYFLLIRPQTKRVKEHRKLMESLNKDDEIVTTGGIMGKIIDIKENNIVLRQMHLSIQ